MPLCRVMSSIYSARIAPTLGKPPCAAAHCGLCLIQPAPSVLGPLAGRGQQLVNAVRVQLRVQRAPAVSLGARGSELPLQLRLIRLLVSALAAPSRGGGGGAGGPPGPGGAPPSAGSSARRPHALTMPLRRPSLCRLGHVRGREAAGGIAIFLCGACAAARMREGCSGYACRCPRARDGRQASKGAL